MDYGLELYTVRKLFRKDWKETLRLVKDTGYSSIELFDCLALDPSELRKAADELGLTMEAAHVVREDLEKRLDEVIAFSKSAGLRYVVFPFALLHSVAETDDLISFLTKTGRILRENGLELLYHNHYTEFDRFEGKTYLERMIENTDPGIVNYEFDVCFMKMKGLDPASFLMEYAERCRIVHLKDYSPEFTVGATEIGKGQIDFPSVLRACRECGITRLIVEQEYFESSCTESIAESLRALRNINC